MKRAAILLCCCLVAPTFGYGVGAAIAQSDTRIASLAWAPGARLPVVISPGNSVTLVFAPSEMIETVSVDDPGAVQVVPSSNGDSLLIHTLRALPPTGMAVETNRRSYRFSLIPATDTAVPYLVRMTYSSAPPQGLFMTPASSAEAPTVPPGIWKLSGTRAIQPSAISDDGVHTYIRWSRDQLIPAVFAVNDVGGEEMVDGYMRDDVFTIDRVNRSLVFRIDRARANAVRVADRGKKP